MDLSQPDFVHQTMLVSVWFMTGHCYLTACVVSSFFISIRIGLDLLRRSYSHSHKQPRFLPHLQTMYPKMDKFLPSYYGLIAQVGVLK